MPPTPEERRSGRCDGDRLCTAEAPCKIGDRGDGRKPECAGKIRNRRAQTDRSKSPKQAQHCTQTIRSFTSSMSPHYHTIQAVPREVTGVRAAAKERSQGRIPSVVFAREEERSGDGHRPVSRKQLLSTEKKQIRSLIKSVDEDCFCSTAFQLQIRAGAGSSCLLESGWVLPIKVHKDPDTGEILNLVFTWVDQNSELPLRIPIVFKGEDICSGLKKASLQHFLYWRCLKRIFVSTMVLAFTVSGFPPPLLGW